MSMPPRRAWLWFLFILLLNYLLMRSLFPDANQPVKIPYTLFKQEVTRDNVAQFTVAEKSLRGISRNR
jgi:cell division protease FtsH